MSYTQRGDRPRVMTPVELVVATAKAKTALWAYIGVARFADNLTGRSSCTVEQVADAVGIGRSQASVGINWLLAHGWITRLVAGRKGSGSSLYEVHMEPVLEGQRPESRALTPGSRSGSPDAEPVAVSGLPDADSPSASGKSVAEALSAPGFPDAEPASASGKPDLSVRKVGRSLVSSLVFNTSSPNSGEEHQREDDTDGGLLPGLLVQAPTPPAAKPKPKRTAHDYPPDFMAFWAAAPRRRGTERGSKPEALKEWRAAIARGVSNTDLIAAAQAYARDADPNYVKDTCRWLKGELYEPYLERAQRHAVGEPTDAELDSVLGKALVTLPAPPAGIDYGTPAHQEWKAQFFRNLRADRVRQYQDRMARRTTRSSA
jgi:hypothetical protein